MKQLKQLELYLNLLLIAGFVISYILTSDNNLLFIAYYTVGAVQLISMIAHAIKQELTGSRSWRIYYHWLTAILLLLAPLGIGLVILLYAAPFMAITYTYICWRELQFLKLREFVHLK